ncbi:hypothetical protein TD95_004604 [Thielaviopsis punctulata]|uniref:Nucleoside transporter FUN26 n=1 Tax=Thielaviopsis punctulata TaxID=72032 RepID=A0A0F4ZD37_9PEZI|nr:hypothetical protein TD95_004604 [Thielaviopsis punctulata]
MTGPSRLHDPEIGTTSQSQRVISAVTSWLRPNRARPASEEYEPLYEAPTALDDEDGMLEDEVPFSWLEYSLFAVIGMAMLWPWNMFLASAPYFQARFSDSDWILQNFQSAILTVSTLTNLIAMFVLTKIQQTASYPFRMKMAFFIDTAVFFLLGLSTIVFVDASPSVYLVFTLLMVAIAALATGLIQNGAFAFSASFARPEYTQAIMAGQGVAGVLPSVAQVLISLAAASKSRNSDTDASAAQVTSAFFPFLTAVLVSIGALVSLVPLVRRHDHIIENRIVERMADSMHSIEEAERASRKVVGMKVLLQKLFWPASSIFICFAVAMFFPVFTAKIVSVRLTETDESIGDLFRPASFIPLAFFFWNLGDLGGRMAAMVPLKVQTQPHALFVISMLRFGFLPMYLLCNIGGQGAAVSSDFFYLFLVQLPFGLTTGWLASSCMMISSECVDEGEREAAGGFMGLSLVAGLSTGSLLSFSVGGL